MCFQQKVCLKRLSHCQIEREHNLHHDFFAFKASFLWTVMAASTLEDKRVMGESERLVKIMGTLAPKTIPAL